MPTVISPKQCLKSEKKLAKTKAERYSVLQSSSQAQTVSSSTKKPVRVLPRFHGTAIGTSQASICPRFLFNSLIVTPTGHRSSKSVDEVEVALRAALNGEGVSIGLFDDEIPP